jgi:tRNA pseudouridine32 synthase/23S rRNA pseudouridine746 synthase/23S rRNA pseudouridine1911/1915/1917 synthase
VRVHLQLLGCPVVGDPVYAGDTARPLHLHARAITIPLYPNREPITVTAPVPLHMQEHLKACGWRGE